MMPGLPDFRFERDATIFRVFSVQMHLLKLKFLCLCLSSPLFSFVLLCSPLLSFALLYSPLLSFVLLSVAFPLLSSSLYVSVRPSIESS